MKERKQTNHTNLHYHFIFPFLVNYSCGNCYKDLGDNLELNEDSKVICPSCGYINENKTSTSTSTGSNY